MSELVKERRERLSADCADTLDEWCEKYAKVLRQDIGIHIENAFCGVVPSIDLERLIMLSIRQWTSNRDRMQDLATRARVQE